MELDKALFASDLPIQKEVKLKLDSGEIRTTQMYFRELPAIEMRKQVLAENSNDQKVVEAALSSLIARAVCDEHGAAVMTVEQAHLLKPVVAGQLRDLIMEVNGLGKPALS